MQMLSTEDNRMYNMLGKKYPAVYPKENKHTTRLNLHRHKDFACLTYQYYKNGNF